MGKRGPRKKLAALDYLDGNPSRRLIAAAGIEGIGEPFIPDHLMSDASDCVLAIMSSMPPGVYRTLDSFALAAFAVAWAAHKRAAEEIAKPDFQFVEINEKTGVSHPSAWLKILNTQAIAIASLGGRLGLDPTSRQALQLPERRRESRFYGLIGPLIEQPGSSRSSKN